MRRLVLLANRHRAPSLDRLLGQLLAFNAGAINAGGFLAIDRYTSHMTGFVSSAADHLVLGDLGAVGVALAAVAVFTSGAVLTSLLVHWGRRRLLHSSYAIPLLLEALLMLWFGLVLDPGSSPGGALAVLLLLAFMMGLQNAVITKVSSSTIRTTHMTGVLTDLGIELGRALYPSRATALPRVQARRGRIALLGSLLGMFVLGGIYGALGFRFVGALSVVPLALAVLSVTVPPLLKDRARRRVRRFMP